MKIDKTIERIVSKIVADYKEKGIELDNQIVYNCIDIVIHSIRFGTLYNIPIQLPYIGKLLPKVTLKVDYLMKKFNNKNTKDDEKQLILQRIREGKEIKNEVASALKKQPTLPNHMIDILLDGYVPKDLEKFKFAFNSKTKEDFIETIKAKTKEEIKRGLKYNIYVEDTEE